MRLLHHLPPLAISHEPAKVMDGARDVQAGLVLVQHVEPANVEAEVALQLLEQRDVDAGVVVGALEPPGRTRAALQLHRHQHQRRVPRLPRRGGFGPLEHAQGEVERIAPDSSEGGAALRRHSSSRRRSWSAGGASVRATPRAWCSRTSARTCSSAPGSVGRRAGLGCSSSEPSEASASSSRPRSRCGRPSVAWVGRKLSRRLHTTGRAAAASGDQPAWRPRRPGGPCPGSGTGPPAPLTGRRPAAPGRAGWRAPARALQRPRGGGSVQAGAAHVDGEAKAGVVLQRRLRREPRRFERSAARHRGRVEHQGLAELGALADGLRVVERGLLEREVGQPDPGERVPLDERAAGAARPAPSAPP